jgi:uncharacterized membrane protein YdbT with pleckstrin-like domain
MTLITCPECSGKVSTQAATCPHCGAPVPSSAVPAAPAGAAPAPAADANAVIWEGSPHYTGTMVWAWICIVAVVLSPVGLVLMLIAHFRTKATRYTLTALRLALRRGLMSTAIDDISLFRIKDIELRQSFWQRLGNIGTILVTSSDTVEPLAELHAVKDPEAVRRLLRAQVDAARQSEGVRTILN